MEKFASADALLDFAILEEEKAAALYTKLASTIKASAAQIFLGFAVEELGHKMKLLQVKGGKQFAPIEGKIMDLKIGDYLVNVELGEPIDYQKALVLAMKLEKAAFRLYMDLHDATTDANLRNLLMALAQEEAKHKLRFEIEYDDAIYRQN